MKKLNKRIISIILLVIFLVAFSACDNAGQKSTKDDNGNKKVTKILLLVAGNLGDKSFQDSSQEGMNLIKKKYGSKVQVKTIELGSDKTKFVPGLEDASEDGYDVIITGTFNMKQPIEQVAPKYPKQTYIVFDTAVDYGKIKGLSNVYTITYKQNEVAFLAGALAAQVTTKTDMKNINPDKKIGFVGAMDNPLINDYLVGYIEGAHYIDKDVKVDYSFTQSFTDAAKGKELALVQYQNDGVDIGFNVAGRAGLGQIDAAQSANKYVIGVDSDQAELFSSTPDKANKILTSALKRVDNTLLRAVDMYMDGKLPKGKTENLGLKEKALGLAENSYYEKLVPQDIRTKMDEVQKKVASGKIKIDSAYGMSSDQLAKIRQSAK